MQVLTTRRAMMAAAVLLAVGSLAGSARAQYPYGYGYGYGPGYNVPVTPGFGATYGGSTFGSYGYGLNRTYTTFGLATGTASRFTAYQASLPPGVYPSTPGTASPGPGAALRLPPVRPGQAGNPNATLPNAPIVPIAGAR